jgi:hypothetical protein
MFLRPAVLLPDDPPLGCGHLGSLLGALPLMMPMAQGPEIGFGVVVASSDVVDLSSLSQALLPSAKMPLTLVVVSTEDSGLDLAPVQGELAAPAAVLPTGHIGPPKKATPTTYRHIADSEVLSGAEVGTVDPESKNSIPYYGITVLPLTG